MCFKKGCGSYRKSIRRNKIEGEFENLVTALTPAREMIAYARRMFRDIWNQLLAQTKERLATFDRQIKDTDHKIDQIVERLIAADNPAVIAAYEKKLTAFEKEKLVAVEKLENCGQPRRPFGEMFELAMEFIGSPQKSWASGQFEQRMTSSD